MTETSRGVREIRKSRCPLVGAVFAGAALAFAVPSAAQDDDGLAPLGYAGWRPGIPSDPQSDFLPLQDRWRIPFPSWERYPAKEGEYPYEEGAWWNPYAQNVIKGDYPVFLQDYFFVFTALSDTFFEGSRIPKPSGIPADEPRNDGFFGRSETLAFNQNFLFSLEFFKGQASFKPKDWELRITPVFNVNYVDFGEENLLDIDPQEEDTTRFDGHIGIQEAFIDYHLGDLSAFYDFISVKAGIQGFTSDFRGFVFSDNNLGIRFFGNWAKNRYQYNLAWFRNLEKDTNSALNTFEDFNDRDQDVFIANLYRQDTIWKGYTTQFSFHYNRDHADEVRFDDNGFLVRPAPIGSVIPDFGIRFHDVDAYYAGWTGEGHAGRLNISHSAYLVFGEDEFNPIAGKKTDIFAQLVAVELSIDRDWLRPKVSVLWASGDDDPLDDDATGFDTIIDNTNFAGSAFSYWNRIFLPFTRAPVFLINRLSFLPTLRSSKIEGQPNFVNPGILVTNLGFEAELTPKLRAAVDVNYLRFSDTESLELIAEQADIDENIGLDYSFGLQYRPLLIDNVIFVASAGALTPFEGLRELLSSETLYSGFLAMTLTY